ncbi:MAG TPA: STAS domain-containing protein [Kiritimatiellia bacterium]|jgi:anti-anti-sigma factor|nr:STAS domain-containing protein [Kiritimatiellia bacterium]OQC58332.1 MAG: Anti-sigma-F factor antagonist RsfB [Verrucomicrobia bacterium ADurb.Bin018]MBP9571759.1 STAS domain-containing protein [Kiritimatiellia bacterium]HOE00610.1 STAS domain-containing protein [Kiritimatiellia bacterium]HOE37409.1 STAS domain-containing protein [Kiritimatiellia bacterium]
MAEAVLTTQIENRDGVQVIHVSGPLDSMTHDRFKDLLDPLVNQSKMRIVLNCENLTYVNSKGLALLGRYQRISLQNLSFMGIAALNKRITKTIELLGMSKLVKLYPSVADAMQAATEQ